MFRIFLYNAHCASFPLQFLFSALPQERLEFEQATQNASLYYRPAHEEEPPADSDDDDADSGSGGNAGGSGSGSSGAPVEGHKGVFATVF